MAATSVSPFREAREVIERRKAAGLHAGMHFTYGRPERSTDPGRIVEDAQALVVALRRYDGGSAAQAEDARDRLAVGRYVVSDEYGQLRQALEAMASELRAAGHVAEVVMDDNRLVDRAVAARAGLGWFGRNTMLLHPELGSWTVIGSVITDAPLPTTDRRIDDGCGECRRCQVECPTGALDTSGVLDANRCLAWLVQAPGRFPVEHRVALGRRIYGCDDCQEVCPINEVASASQPIEIQASRRPPVAALDLLESDDADLMAELEHWFIPRRQPEYLRRNALVALANMAEVAHEQPARVERVLRGALDSPSPIVRGHAVWAAHRLGRRDLIDAAIARGGLHRDDPEGVVAAELEEIAA